MAGCNVFFYSDPHFFHKNVARFRKIGEFVTEVEQREEQRRRWNKVVKKNDVVYILGDVVVAKWTDEVRDFIKSLNGRKILILGNHCTERDKLVNFIDVFESVHGVLKYKEFWLSHIPLNRRTLFGKLVNVHGHTHAVYDENDPHYFNVSADVIDFTPIRIDILRERIAKKQEIQGRFFNKVKRMIELWRTVF